MPGVRLCGSYELRRRMGEGHSHPIPDEMDGSFESATVIAMIVAALGLGVALRARSLGLRLRA